MSDNDTTTQPAIHAQVHRQDTRTPVKLTVEVEGGPDDTLEDVQRHVDENLDRLDELAQGNEIHRDPR